MYLILKIQASYIQPVASRAFIITSRGLDYEATRGLTLQRGGLGSEVGGFLASGVLKFVVLTYG